MMHRELFQLDARTSVEAVVGDDRSYHLCLWHDGELLIEFACDGGEIHHRRVRERTSAYEFRSVEQLRYDFEREIETLVGER